jgi:hypothetical protein
MARFNTVLTVVIDAYSAEEASRRASEAVSAGTSHSYFVSGEVTSVEPAPVLRYTQAEFDAAVIAAAEDARTKALAERSNA